MLFTTLLTPLLATSVTAGLVARGDIKVIEADVRIIIADQNSTASAINAFNGSTSSFGPVITGYDQVLKDVYKFGNDSNPSFDNTGCTAVTNLITTDLESTLNALLNNLVAKKPQFTASGLKAYWKSKLGSLQTAYANAFNNYCTQCSSKACSDETTKNKNEIQAAINSYT